MKLKERFYHWIRPDKHLLRWLIYQRVYINPKLKKNIVDQFHKFYHDRFVFGETWGKTFWLGIPTQKLPLDLWIYQEIIYDIKPEVIIETGTECGGSALFLASMCDLVQKGRVMTVDIVHKEGRPQHPRIQYLLGSSTSKEIEEQVREAVRGASPVMVILDSDHHKDHVLKELNIFSKFVSPGSYLIVEDTDVNGHPVFAEYGPGPMEAVEEFLKTHDSFAVDREREKLYLTFNPGGYLKKLGS